MSVYERVLIYIAGMYQQMINAKNDDFEVASDEMSKDLERNVKEDSEDMDKPLEVKGMSCMCLLYWNPSPQSK